MNNSAWSVKITGENFEPERINIASTTGCDVFSGSIVTSGTDNPSYAIVDFADLGKVQDTNPGIFSRKTISKKGEISDIELEAFVKKINVIMRLEKDWNGPSTFPPSEPAIRSAIEIINYYQAFIRKNEIPPANMQIYPLNSGGVGLEFITRVLSLEIKLLDKNIGSTTGKIEYYITDDANYDSEGEAQSSEIERLFVQLHVALRDI